MTQYLLSLFVIVVIRLWDIECGACLRVLEGHEELVRCIRFDSKRIVSGAYDGKIKVWDLVAALDPRAQASALCLKTLVVRCFDNLSATLTIFFSLFFSYHIICCQQTHIHTHYHMTFNVNWINF